MNASGNLRRTAPRALCAGLAIVCATPFAPAQRDAAPFEEVVTDAGSRIWAFPDDGGDRFVLMLYVGSGSRDEVDAQAGIAHYVEHVLFTSTSQHSKQELDSAVKERGGAYNGFTDHECTVFHITTNAADWRFAIDWLTQHVLQPAFAPADVDAERRIVCEELDLRNPHAGSLTFEALLYPDHALGRGIGGDKSSVRGCSMEDLKRFYGDHYRAANVAVGFAGRVPREECTAMIRSALASLAPGDVERSTRPVRPRAATMIMGLGDGEASGSVTLGYHLPTAGTRELATQLAIATYLEGRFFDEVREARQMAYAPDVDLYHYSDTHRLQFDTHVSDQNNLPAVVAVCDTLITELSKLDAPQLERVRESLRTVLQTNSAESLAEAMKLCWLARRHDESPKALVGAIEQLDAAAVAAYAAQNLVPANRFLISNSMLLSTGPNTWVMLGIALLICVIIDGARGFALTRGLSTRLSTWRRRRAKPPPKRTRQSVPSKIEPIDASELEASIQRYFEAEDRKRGRR